MADTELRKLKRPIAGSFIYIFGLLLLFSSLGCDAFVRKFTRKSKKDTTSVQELVLAPEEYKPPQMTKEEQYRQYFLFWKSWQDELINSLTQNLSRKKQLDCLQEAVKNLVNLKDLLNQAMQARLEVHILQLNDLKREIANDIYGSAAARYYKSAEQIKMNILREFSYNKIKDSLI
jgi:hypothetical protein